MSAILSDQFRFYNLENFIRNLSSSSIYLFIGRSYPWDNETSPAIPIDNLEYQYDVYDQMIALKKLSISNIIPVIRRIDWTEGVTYDMYRPDYTTGNSEYVGSGNTNLRYPSKLSTNSSATLNYGANFYVMNEFYQVYKCLYNGQTPSNPNGIPSTVQPTGINTTPFVTTDGYRWKYMFTIPTFYVLNFLNEFYIPVPYPNTNFPQETSVTSNAVAGSIDTVVILNGGTGYNNGTYNNVPIVGDGSNGRVTINVSNGSISQVTVTSPGTNYTFGTVDISSTSINSGSGTGLNLEVIIPPKYGHGNSPYDELGAYRLMIHASIAYNESEFPTDCSYRRVGIIANPYSKGSGTTATANNISGLNTLTVASFSNNFQVGEIITQPATNARGRVVSWDSTNKRIRYYQDRFDGTYQNNLVAFSAGSGISGLTSNSIGLGTTNIVTSGIEKGTGRILYIDNRVAVNRAPSQIEDIKIVVEF